MLKIVVYDSGYGGELLADKIEEELPIVEVIRVIDWRNAKEINKSARAARKAAEAALTPYIGKVDLIIFANYLLSITSLKYFRNKYKNQRFLGFKLKYPTNTTATTTITNRPTLILTTSPVAQTYHFHRFTFKVRRIAPSATIVCLDTWQDLIDDGELTKEVIKYDSGKHLARIDFHPTAIILACSHFSDIRAELQSTFHGHARIYDGYQEMIRDIHRVLRIRGGLGKIK